MSKAFQELNDPKVSALVNHRLELMRLLLPQLTLRDLRLWVSHIHIGKGFYPKGYKVSAHTHPEFQIESVLSGLAYFEFEHHVTTIRAGQTLFIPPDTSHHWKAKSAVVMVGITLNLTGPERGNFIQKCNLKHSTGAMIVDAGKENALPQILRKMPRADESPLFIEQQSAQFVGWLCRTLLKAFDLEHWKTAQVGPLTREDRATDLISKAMQYMQDNISEPLGTEDISEHVGISSRQLNRLFEEFGEYSLARSLNRIRLNKSLEMLQSHPEYSIEGIARDCGFKSHSYFTQKFIAAFGIKPSEIQATSGKTHQNR